MIYMTKTIRHMLGQLLALYAIQAFAQSGSLPTISSQQLPTSGHVTAGQALITQSSGNMTVNQTSQRAVLDWGTFNVGKDAQVNFLQPNAQAAILNRVTASDPSQILGRITAPGQVVLVNAQGVYFGKTSTVDVGSLVATTHQAVNEEFMAGTMKFQRQGATGRVVNEGDLRAALGGYIALLAPETRNEGVIVANLGTVGLIAGETYVLQFDSTGNLSNLRVSAATLNTLVENNKAIRAPGGLIILSAQAASRLQSAVVNNTGSMESTGLVRRDGRILLDASSAFTTTLVSSGSLILGAGTVQGSLNLNVVQGDLTQVGPVRVNGATTLVANSGSVTLTDPDNLFGDIVDVTSAGALSLTSGGPLTLGHVTTVGNTILKSNGPLNLGTSTFGGTLQANSGGFDITQSGPIKFVGDADFNAGNATINLFDSKNNWSGLVKVQGGNVSINHPQLVNTVSAGTLLASADLSSPRVENSFSKPKRFFTRVVSDDSGLGQTAKISVSEVFKDLPANTKVEFNLLNGSPLPDWLKLDEKDSTLIATNPPADAFPLQLRVRVGSLRTTMRIEKVQR